MLRCGHAVLTSAGPQWPSRAINRGCGVIAYEAPGTVAGPTRLGLRVIVHHSHRSVTTETRAHGFGKGLVRYHGAYAFGRVSRCASTRRHAGRRREMPDRGCGREYDP